MIIMQDNLLRVATRTSPLALCQTKHVCNELLKYHPKLKIKLIPIITDGDKIISKSLKLIGGKGLFIKLLELALLECRADIAVHSMKDVTSNLPDGLILSTLCKRNDPRDAFVSNTYTTLNTMPYKAVIGTSSLRRQCQLLAHRPDLQVFNLRGNIDTRLMKLDQGYFDAIILSVAGLQRLGLENRINIALNPDYLLPAVGQGAIGIECRLNDHYTMNLLTPLHHHNTSICVNTERELSAQLNGGCQVPIASYAKINDNKLWLRALIGTPNGNILIRSERTAFLQQSKQLVSDLVKELIDRGANNILHGNY